MEDENSITEEEINIALRAAVMDMAIIPMIAGSSFKKQRVQFMLDAVCKYLPSQWIKRRDHPDDAELLEEDQTKILRRSQMLKNHSFL
jgi:elongation factor G